MKSVKIYYIFAAILVVSAVSVVFGQGKTAAGDKAVADEFVKNVKDYVKLRERIEGKLPKLPTKATPEQIEAHKAALEKSVRSARVGASQGNIFTPQASAMIRSIIKTEFKGRDRQELRETVFGAETKGVPVRVNYAYPESKELLEMPPSLLLALPQLPKQIRYRFVGTYLLLVDRENNLIIDYMRDALP